MTPVRFSYDGRPQRSLEQLQRDADLQIAVLRRQLGVAYPPPPSPVVMDWKYSAINWLGIGVAVFLAVVFGGIVLQHFGAQPARQVQAQAQPVAPTPVPMYRLEVRNTSYNFVTVYQVSPAGTEGSSERLQARTWKAWNAIAGTRYHIKAANGNQLRDFVVLGDMTMTIFP